MPVSADPRIGSELLGYRVEDLLGRGGMSVVYRASDPKLKRQVALKLLAPELAADAEFRDRFLTESELAASLEHPTVVPIYDAGEVDGQMFIVMRLVEGQDLKGLIREEGRLEPARALAILSQVADALDAAHARGLVHRDVKPSNVLLDEEGHAYLADFGLTRRVEDRNAFALEARSLGTIDYVAPEQIEGKDADGRADVYALGCVLYECLAGAPLFPRGSEAAVLYAHLEEKPPALGGEIDAVIGKALAKSPDDRYASCADLIAAAREALGIAEPRRARSPLAIAGIGAVLIGAALLAFFLARGEDGKPRRAAPQAGDGRIVRVDAATGKRLATIPFGQDLSSVAVGAGSVWVGSLTSGTLARIDPRTEDLVETISVAGARSGPSSIAVDGNLVWIVNAGDDKVRLYRAAQRQFSEAEPRLAVATYPGCACPDKELPAVARGRWLWTVSEPHKTVERFAADQTTSMSALLDRRSDPTDLALGEGAVWAVTTASVPALYKLDSQTNARLGRVELAPTASPSGLAAGEGGVWIANYLDDTVLRIDPDTLEIVARIRVGQGPDALAVGAGSVWVANNLDGTVSRIDPATNTVAGTFEVGPYPDHLAVGEGSVWVTLDSP